MRKAAAFEGLGYLIGLALLGPFIAPLVGLGDELATPGSLRWRFGVLGTVFNSVGFLLLAYLTAAFWAAYRNHRGAMFGIALMCAVSATAFLGGSALFALDFIQFRQLLDPAIRGDVTVQSVRAGALGVLGFFVLLGLTLSLIKTARALSPRVRAAAAPLIR